VRKRNEGEKKKTFGLEKKLRSTIQPMGTFQGGGLKMRREDRKDAVLTEGGAQGREDVEVEKSHVY